MVGHLYLQMLEARWELLSLVRNSFIINQLSLKGDISMSGLKSSWELSLERSEDLVPELKSQKKLTKKQKEEIAEIRKDYTAQIADRDVTMQDKVRKLSDRVAPEEIADAKRLLETEFREEKQSLEEEMEKEIESIRSSKG